MRIVLVDDDNDFRETLTDILRDIGNDVYAFDNPYICPLKMMPECRCKENEVCTDMIITDLQMPAIDGLQFVQIQKDKHCKCMHIILISGSITDEAELTAKNLGCKIFTKPLKLDYFLKWIKEVHISPNRELRDWFKEN